MLESSRELPETRPPELRLIAGRLALDFANAAPPDSVLRWQRLIDFLQSTQVVTPERATQLLLLHDSDPNAAEALLQKAVLLAASLRKCLQAMLGKQRLSPEWITPINQILRITEGHDELILEGNAGRIEFIAREGGLDWLLAAIARSAAELITEGPKARLRICANRECGHFFYDDSRTHQRRWCSMALCGNRHKVASYARRHTRR
jgi:predicted RNA-binding Zn ribbon-like protein